MENLIGQHFNRWLVIDYAPDRLDKNGKRKSRRWLCKCICEKGTIKIQDEHRLKRGDSKSCGCYKKEVLEKDIPIGSKFNKLTVVSRDLEKSNCGNGVYWLCKCDCGNESLVSVSGGSLRKNGTKSCGCLIEEHNKKFIENGKKYNTYDLTGEYGIGYTEEGEKFYFDLEDYDKINKQYWSINSEGYVIAYTGECRKMHRLITNANEKDVVDHINTNRNDNRKINLRKVTSQQNGMNHQIANNNTSGVTGVKLNKKSPVPKWVAEITYKGERIYLGYYSDFSEAVKVRKEAEIKYFGEYRYNPNANIVS